MINAMIVIKELIKETNIRKILVCSYFIYAQYRKE